LNEIIKLKKGKAAGVFHGSDRIDGAKWNGETTQTQKIKFSSC